MGSRLAESTAEMHPPQMDYSVLSIMLGLCFTCEAACAAVAKLRTLDECRTGLMYSGSSCVEKHASHIEN